MSRRKITFLRFGGRRQGPENAVYPPCGICGTRCFLSCSIRRETSSKPVKVLTNFCKKCYNRFEIPEKELDRISHHQRRMRAFGLQPL